MPGNGLPEHILALVEGAETAPSVTALSHLLRKQGHWHMSPGVVRATCEMLEEEGVDVRRVPRTDDLTVSFPAFDVTPEVVREALQYLESVYREFGCLGTRVQTHEPNLVAVIEPVACATEWTA
jgi:hypothetical protein